VLKEKLSNPVLGTTAIRPAAIHPSGNLGLRAHAIRFETNRFIRNQLFDHFSKRACATTDPVRSAKLRAGMLWRDHRERLYEHILSF